MTNLPYRLCAGVMIVNRDGDVFVGQRIDSTQEAWQMPQGGIEVGEDPQQAALREMHEETGITADKITIIARAKQEYCYDLPSDMIGKLWQGQYRGQRQIWFLMRFHGADTDIDIARVHAEFRAWRWTDIDKLPALIVPFKRTLYQAVVAEFRAFI